MLPERSRQLLTAFVDGELSSRQRRFVDRLLRRSRDARELLRKLQGDSHELQALSSATPILGVDLADTVLETIATRKLTPQRVRVALPSQPLQVPAWVGFAIAAGLLITVGLGSYLFFSRTPGKDPGAGIARTEPFDEGATTLDEKAASRSRRRSSSSD